MSMLREPIEITNQEIEGDCFWFRVNGKFDVRVLRYVDSIAVDVFEVTDAVRPPLADVKVADPSVPPPPHGLYTAGQFAQVPPSMTKRELALTRGFEVFDCTLPQPWLDGIVDEIAVALNKKWGTIPNRNDIYRAMLTGVVWCYDEATLGGAPAFITEQAHRLHKLARPEQEETTNETDAR